MTTRTPLRILIVEDSTLQARFLEQTLREMDPPPTEVVCVYNLAEAVGRLGDSMDLVLLDLVLPDSQGIDTFRAVHRAHPELPIIVLSGTGNETLALLAVAEGAQDYLFKSSVSPEALARSIRYSVERHRKFMEQRRNATIDDLTGVSNRRGFTLLAEQHLAMARRSGTTLTALFVDVDGLKQINDVFGHEDGDRLLGDLAELMKSTFRSCDVIGRVGGDEFCAFLVNDVNTPAAATRLRQAIHDHNASGRRRFRLSCSIGNVSVQPAEGSTLAEILSKADQAMYEEKRAVHALYGDHASADRAGALQSYASGAET